MEEDSQLIKVLVISSNPLSTTSNNGKTLASFFGDWPQENLAQLFFYPDLPTSSICRNYFRITDSEMLHGLFRRGSDCGSRVNICKREVPESIPDRRFYRESVVNSELARLGRELIWLSGAWETPGLWDWVENFAPTVIFFNVGGNIFQYRIAQAIARRLNIPIALIVWDDYFLPRISVSPSFWLRLAWLRSSLMSLCKPPQPLMINLCKGMSDSYKEHFGISSIVLPYSIELPKVMPPPPPVPSDGKARLIYLGGLHLNRWKTLGRLGRVLAENAINAKLEIYCQQQPSAKMLDEITIQGFSEYCGALTASGVAEKLLEGSILVHVESFDRVNRGIARLSISTKIPEYLASARCILAIGPREVASIDYLASMGCAKVVTDLDGNHLVEALREIVTDEGAQASFRLKAWEIAISNHDLSKTRTLFKEALRKLQSPFSNKGKVGRALVSSR